ncbi:MAG: acyl carrier protein [Candidatus Izemoplasmatales bacterium]
MSFTLLQKIIADALNINQEDVVPEADLSSDLGADSLDAAELMMTIEDSFKISISDNDAQKLKTVGDIWTFIESCAKQ